MHPMTIIANGGCGHFRVIHAPSRERPLLAEGSRSAKINEGPFTLEFSLIGKYSQGRLMIACGSCCENNESLLLAHTTLSTKLHEYLTQGNW